MGSLPTGSDTILHIRTSDLDFVIKAKGNVKKSAVSQDEEGSTIKVIGADIECISVPSQGIRETYDDKGIYAPSINVSPLFFEQTDYLVTIQSKNNSKLAFSSNSPLITDKIRQVTDDPSLILGVINYGNSVGFSDFRVYSNGKNLLSLRIEVYPTKISYKQDYREMMADINDLINGSIIDFMRNTYQGFDPEKKHNNIPAVFFAIMQGIYKDYIKAVNRIVSVPHHRLVSEYVVQPHYKAKLTDNQSEKWLLKHPEYIKKDNGRILAEKVLAVRKHTTYDTQENQLVKFMLESTIRKLEDFHDRYLASVNNPDKAITDGTRKMESELRRLINTTFLSDVSSFSSTKSMSLVFGMAPGYRELYKYYLMLQNGLSVNGEVFKLSYKDTALLYEYWCFIKLYSILKERYTLKSPDIIKVDRKGVTVNLVKGVSSRIKFKNDDTGEEIVLSYNPAESKTQTVNQKPDNVLELAKNGTKTRYKYVFDAKYKIETNPESDYYPDDNPGPKVDDINTMHRYRDAIVYENPESRFVFEKTMFGAYILFPYKDEEKYKNHRFYKSIDAVNIGGLPFLPSATELVTELLDELISDSAETAFEHTSLPLGIDNKLANVEWNRRDVLVLAISSDNEFNDYMTGRYCDIPAEIINDKSDIHYVALYKSKDHFRTESGVDYYGEIQVVPSLVKGEDKELRFRFKVDNWNKLSNRIETKEIGFDHIYTNLFLLENSTEIPELLIKSEEMYRLYRELKRRMIQAEISDDSDSRVMKLYGREIRFDKDRFELVKGKGNVVEYMNSDFMKKPNSTLRSILGHFNGKGAVAE